MKKIIAILIAILTVVSIAIAEEPITAGNIGPVPDTGKLPSGWYLSSDYEMGMYWDNDLGQWTDWHYHNDAYEYIHLKSGIKKSGTGTKYMDAYCDICDAQVKAKHKHTYVTTIEEGSLMNGIYKGHWYIDTCVCEYCNDVSLQFERHSEDVIDWTDEDGTYHKRTFCYLCGYEVEEITPAEEPTETGAAPGQFPTEGWCSESYSTAYYQHKDGSRTNYHSHDESASNITVTGTVKTDWLDETYVGAYCNICNESVKAKHTHDWNMEIVSDALLNGDTEGHKYIYTCTDSYCGKVKTTFATHDIDITTWIDDNYAYHTKRTCSGCNLCEEEVCYHTDNISWRVVDEYGSWYCDDCGLKIGEDVYVGPSVPSPYGYVRLNVPMLVRHNPNTLYTGTFSASDYCYIAPWSSSVIVKNAITIFDGLKYYQTNEYGTVIVELLDSETGAVAFAHAEDVTGIESIILEGEEIVFSGIEPITTGEWVDLPDWIFRIYDENCEHDWQLVYVEDGDNYTMYCKCDICGSTKKKDFNVFASDIHTGLEECADDEHDMHWYWTIVEEYDYNAMWSAEGHCSKCSHIEIKMEIRDLPEERIEYKREHGLMSDSVIPTIATSDEIEWITLPDFLYRITDPNCEHEWHLEWLQDGNHCSAWMKCINCGSTMNIAEYLDI